MWWGGRVWIWEAHKHLVVFQGTIKKVQPVDKMLRLILSRHFNKIKAASDLSFFLFSKLACSMKQRNEQMYALFNSLIDSQISFPISSLFSRPMICYRKKAPVVHGLTVVCSFTIHRFVFFLNTLWLWLLRTINFYIFQELWQIQL